MTSKHHLARALCWRRCYSCDSPHVCKGFERETEVAAHVCAGLEAQGLTIVPLEPTEEMKFNGEMAVIRGGAPDFIGGERAVTCYAAVNKDEATKIYKAMLSANAKD